MLIAGVEPVTHGLRYRCSTNWAKSAYLMTRTGFEPMLPPWKGGVLTTWPTDQYITEKEGFEPSRRFPDLHP